MWGSEVVTRPDEGRSRDVIFEPKGSASRIMKRDVKDFAERMVDRQQMQALTGFDFVKPLLELKDKIPATEKDMQKMSEGGDLARLPAVEEW